MDLGATICTPKKPACALCPWMDDCAARRRGDPETFPRKAPKKTGRLRRGAAFVAMRADGAVLVRTRAPKGLLGGMTEVPTTDWTHDFAEDTALAEAPMPRAKLRWRRLPGVVAHVFTHFPLELAVYTANVAATDAGAGRHALGRARRSGRRGAAQSHAQSAGACARIAPTIRREIGAKHGRTRHGIDATHDADCGRGDGGCRTHPHCFRRLGAEPALSRSRDPDARSELQQVSPRARRRGAAYVGHALVRGTGLFRRCALPAVERHSQQPPHALGRGHRPYQRLSPAVEQFQRQHPRPPGPARHLRARHAGA